MISKKLFALLALSLSATPLFAEAPGFVKKGATTKKSSYSTKKDDQGVVGVRVTIFANGNSGEYQPNGSSQKGRLSDIRYNRDIGNGNVADMAGTWEFGGTKGTFFWFFNGNEFTCSYRKSNDGQYTPTDGFWNGSF